MILQTIPNSFIASDGKTIRVSMVEDGEPVEIGLALTAKKDLEGGGAVAAPVASSDIPVVDKIAAIPEKIVMTEEEIDNVKTLMESLGL